MKKRGAGSVLVRLGLLTVLSAGGVFGYQKFAKPALADPNRVSGLMKNVQGISSDLHLDGVIDAANKKLVESQPIITDQVNNASTDVLGDTTNNITEGAKQLIQNTATQIGDQVKDLPRQEAVNITKSICEQIVRDLEKK